MHLRLAAAAGVILAAILGAGMPRAQAASFTAYGISYDKLLRLGPNNPTATNPQISVTNLQGGENLAGIDYNASDDLLYVVTDQNRMYTVNRGTGEATQVGSAPFADAATHVVSAFEIMADTGEARIVTKSNHNLRVSLATGQLVGTDTILAYAAGDPQQGNFPVIGGASYGADNTLYGMDENLNTLVRIGGPSGVPSGAGGSVTTIGALGAVYNEHDTGDNLMVPHHVRDGMDVGPDGTIYICKGTTFEIIFSEVTIFAVDPATGHATQVHWQNLNPAHVRGIAVVAEEVDSDQDGVLDYKDLCPGTSPGAVVNETGCPNEAVADITGVLISSSQKCNAKTAFCKRKFELRVLKTPAVTNKKVLVNFYASVNDQFEQHDQLLGSKYAKFNKKTGIGKAKYTAKLGNGSVHIIAVVDSANEVLETDESNNAVVVPVPAP